MTGANEWPHCGSLDVIEFRRMNRLPDLDGEPPVPRAYCLGCRAVWETLDPADMFDPDDPLSAFKRPCDNCAFRKGSPERADPVKWELLMQRLQLHDTPFVCHKDGPLSDKPDESHDGFPAGAGIDPVIVKFGA